MGSGFFKLQEPANEPVLDYLPGSPERKEVKEKLQELRSREVEIPLIIGGREVRTNDMGRIAPPHDHGHTLGKYHKAGEKEVQEAVAAALEGKDEWARTPWEDRAAIFKKAAELLTGPYRSWINAATMLGQSKTIHQAEIEACCELADFLRFNTYYMTKIYSDQPFSPEGFWNRMEYRPLEGFVLAITPFNFTAIGGNLPTSAAMMGNVVLWKPASTAVYSNYVLMQILMEAGLPPGVINFLPGSGGNVGNPAMENPHLAGIHFTGSTEIFHHVWRTVGNNMEKYKVYPRLVGETGGKDFVVAHRSARIDELVTALICGAFEYQGQKCSAASRAYIPQNLWPQVEEELLEEIKTIKMGPAEDFTNFVNAVIDKKAFDKIIQYIEGAKADPNAEILIGGGYDDSKGYFIEPTVILTTDPHYRTMEEEIFGPVLTIYVYPTEEYRKTLELCDRTSPYGLTGSIFARDRAAIRDAEDILYQAAGNFYINDKPTAAVVNQQPFGGARASGTNDKAGSYLNLLRWVSPRAIKETFVPPVDYRYPFMEEE